MVLMAVAEKINDFVEKSVKVYVDQLIAAGEKVTTAKSSRYASRLRREMRDAFELPSATKAPINKAERRRKNRAAERARARNRK